MRCFLVHVLTAWILFAMIIGPGLAGAEARSNLAVRGEGYIGYSRIDIDTGSADTDADGFEGGGTGSVSVLFDSIYLQADLFGDASEFDSADPDRVGAAGHLGWRDATRGSLGVVGAINHVDAGGSDTDEWRAGIEGQVFFDRFTGGSTPASSTETPAATRMEASSSTCWARSHSIPTTEYDSTSRAARWASARTIPPRSSLPAASS